MKRLIASLVTFLMIVLFCTFPAQATQSLKIVQVDQNVHCMFDPTCNVVATTTVSTFTVPGMSGTGSLYTTTFQTSPASPAAGYNGFEYRIDLQNVVGITGIKCIGSMRIALGSQPIFLDLNGDGIIADQIYVISTGGLGTIAPTLAAKDGPFVTFYFDPQICGGGSPGTGDSSFVFGALAAGFPRGVLADLQVFGGSLIETGAQAPNLANKLEFQFSLLYSTIVKLNNAAFVAPTPKAAEGKRQTMLNETNAALTLARNGNVLPAVQKLQRLLLLTDGQGSDWVRDDPTTRIDERENLFDVIQETIRMLQQPG